MQLQTLAATQKGSEVAERTYTVGQTTSQAQDRQVRDLDFESGRFFWVVDPDSLPGYPGARHPQAITGRPRRRPTGRRRCGSTATAPPAARAAPTRTSAASPRWPAERDSPQQFGPVRWELLIQGTDYYLDPVRASGSSLATKLDQNDYLAVSYRTAAGNVGRHLPRGRSRHGHRRRRPQARDTLELIVQPQQGPEPPDLPLRDAADLPGGRRRSRPARSQVGITLNRSERPLSRQRGDLPAAAGPRSRRATPTVFDRDNRLFPAQPRSRRGARSSASRTSCSRTSSRSPTPTELTPAERVRLAVPHAAVPAPVPGAAGQVRPAAPATTPPAAATARRSISTRCSSARAASSSTCAAGSWSAGSTTPSPTTSARSPSSTPTRCSAAGTAQVTARFEEQGLFAVAPTTHPRAGHPLLPRRSRGDQPDRHVPAGAERLQPASRSGFEASANLIGGVNTELHFKPKWRHQLPQQLMTDAAPPRRRCST